MAISEENKNPYHGVFLVNVLFLIIPWFLFGILYPIVLEFGDMNKEQSFYFSLFFAFLLQLLFELICIICGLTHDSFMALKNRIKNFISNCSISFKLAWLEYKEEVKETGLAYWLFFITINYSFIITIGSFLYLFDKIIKYYI